MLSIISKILKAESSRKSATLLLLPTPLPCLRHIAQLPKLAPYANSPLPAHSPSPLSRCPWNHRHSYVTARRAASLPAHSTSPLSRCPLCTPHTPQPNHCRHNPLPAHSASPLSRSPLCTPHTPQPNHCRHNPLHHSLRQLPSSRSLASPLSRCPLCTLFPPAVATLSHRSSFPPTATLPAPYLTYHHPAPRGKNSPRINLTLIFHFLYLACRQRCRQGFQRLSQTLFLDFGQGASVVYLKGRGVMFV